MDRLSSAGERHGRFRTTRRQRLIVALGDAKRELALLAALDEREDFATEVCVHAADLLARVRGDDLDFALLSSELPGLGRDEVAELARSPVGARTALLTADPSARRWAGSGLAAILPLETTPEELCTTLVALARMDGRGKDRARATAVATPASTIGAAKRTAADPPFAVLAVASGAGSPGRSTVALGLAAALGAVAPTVLVDADLFGPSLAALLDADPRRNLFQLAYARPGSREEWTEALTRALQPLGPRSPHGRLLCGLATPAMRAGVAPGFLGDLLGELRARFRHVILDLGAGPAGADVALHRAALVLADQILLVTTPDIVDLARAQVALAELARHPGVAAERIALIANRHDRRRHPGRREIEWGLGRPLAALLPHDHRGVARTRHARRPVVLDRRSRLGRAVLELAGRIHGGTIVLPPGADRARWRRLLDRLSPRRGRRERTAGDLLTVALPSAGQVRGRKEPADGD